MERLLSLLTGVVQMNLVSSILIIFNMDNSVDLKNNEPRYVLVMVLSTDKHNTVST